VSKTIDRLLTDHRRLRNVLGALDQKMQELGSEDLEADTDHLFCLADYLTNYPDHVHHPLEDVVFERLLKQDLSEAQRQIVEHNRSQHENLTAATKRLSQQIDRMSGSFDVEALRREVDDYIDRQRKHMAYEEREVFPLALSCLSSTTWDELDASYGESSDPLFDEADRRYGTIYRFLVVDPEEREPSRSAEPLLRYLGATGIPWVP
jgi:hemerythrin-like domain-containing protein